MTTVNPTVNRVLALSMRPKILTDCIGQEDLSTTLQTQFSTGRIPHFYIIHGPVGAGKTTLARILALALQGDPSIEERLQISEDDWLGYKKYDIHEINAANKNGIDDIRGIVEMMKYKPMAPSRAKVVILDEAHQLTSAAQNALITETEDVAKHVYYIFCTSALPKIIPALQRRAYMMSPKPLSEDDIFILLQKAATYIEYTDDVIPLHEALVMNSVTSPGIILQAAEKYFSGIPPNEAVYNNEACKLDTMAICRAVASGSWKNTATLLKPINKADIIMVKNCVMGYLKTALMNSEGNKALTVAKAIRNIADSNGSECIPTFMANLCVACEHIKSNSR